MSKSVTAAEFGQVIPPQSIRRMDHAVEWLDEPARRLRRMLTSIPGFAAITHVSLSLHDGSTDMLWSFPVADIPRTSRPEVQEVDMTDVPSLVLMADSHEPRIVSDLADFGDESRLHSPGIRSAGCRSSMTVPIHWEGELLGFLIYGAKSPHFFTPAVREVLDTYSEAFAILVIRALDATTIRC